MPLEARILNAATEYEEVIRHFSDNQPHGSIAEEFMIPGRSTRYDPDVVDSLLSLVK